MAANFWASSHYKHLLDPEEVDLVNPIDKEKGLTQKEFKLIKIHMTNLIARPDIWRLAQQVKVRQRVIATAVTYFRRVYTRCAGISFLLFFVLILLILFLFFPPLSRLAFSRHACVRDACMREEGAGLPGSDEKYRFEIKDILEMEMKLLEALDYYLVVFHPYRSLLQLLQDANMTDLTHISWGLVNDTYKMDLILIYPPHMIALACIYIASVLKDKETTAWFEELRVDMNTVKNISMEILDFYDSRVDAFKGIPEAYKSMMEEKLNAALNKLALKR